LLWQQLCDLVKRKRSLPARPLLSWLIKIQEEPVDQLEGLPSGVHPLDLPAQLFPEDPNSINDDQILEVPLKEKISTYRQLQH
jgi:hypothetical protein